MSNVGVEAYWKLSASIGKDGVGAKALRHSDFLNAKVAALLTHVSLMVVTTLWFLTYTKAVDDTNLHTARIATLVNMSLGIELLVYIVITVLCLRAIWVTSPSTFSSIIRKGGTIFPDAEQKRATDIFMDEVTLRKRCFAWGAEQLSPV